MVDSERTRNFGVIVVGLGLVVLGVLFLVSQFFGFNIWGVIWPFFIIVPGCSFSLAWSRWGRVARRWPCRAALSR